MYSKNQLRKMFRMVMNKNKHTYRDVYSLTGMCMQTIHSILFKPDWKPNIRTLEKIEHYISAFTKDSNVVIHTTTEETYVSTKEETIIPNHEEKHNLKIENKLKDTFLESYNKLLNPLGYQVKIVIEPMAVI